MKKKLLKIVINLIMSYLIFSFFMTTGAMSYRSVYYSLYESLTEYVNIYNKLPDTIKELDDWYILNKGSNAKFESMFYISRTNIVYPERKWYILNNGLDVNFASVTVSSMTNNVYEKDYYICTSNPRLQKLVNRINSQLGNKYDDY